MDKLYTSKSFLKMAGRKMHKCIPLILLPGSACGRKLQKPSKESGIFWSLGIISFVLFY